MADDDYDDKDINGFARAEMTGVRIGIVVVIILILVYAVASAVMTLFPHR